MKEKVYVICPWCRGTRKLKNAHGSVLETCPLCDLDGEVELELLKYIVSVASQKLDEDRD